jgi:hypothetical protein
VQFFCTAYVGSWHICDIARWRMDVCFRRKTGRAVDIAAMTEFDPPSGLREHSRDLLSPSLTTRWKRGIIPALHE